jgi:transcriptional regulator with XRE-family HTH domain
VTARGTTTVRRRRLASELRRLRRAAGVSLEDAARHLDVAHSTLSRIETGQAVARTAYVDALARMYRVDEVEHEALVKLAREARQRSWWHAYGDVLSRQYGAYIGLEAEASSVRNYETLLVPGLLQTETYARTVITAMLPDATPEEVERKVAVRLTRQRRLVEQPVVKFWAIVNESVLVRPTGGEAVMREQNGCLAELAGLTNVTLQVLPLDVGAHAGMLGSFSLLSFPDPRDEDVAYVDTPAGEIYLETPEEVERLTLAYDHIRSSALSVSASIDRVNALTKGSP